MSHREPRGCPFFKEMVIEVGIYWLLLLGKAKGELPRVKVDGTGHEFMFNPFTFEGNCAIYLWFLLGRTSRP